jgi:hypothetical protein
VGIQASLVSSSTARLLTGTDLVRFLPATSFAGKAYLAARAWDGSTGIAGNTANTTISGGTSAFSTTFLTATIVVNNAPTLGTAPTLTNVPEDTTKLFGISILPTNDDNAGALKGVALVGASGAGNWEYALNGVTFLALGNVSYTSARLLPSTATVRFRPVTNQTGQASLTYLAWDQTQGIAGSLFAVTTGGANAFSAGTATIQFNVTPVNDAPTWSANNATLTPIVTNTVSPVGDTINSFCTGIFQDAETPNTIGVVAVGSTGLGTWQYSRDSGNTWTSFGLLSDATGRLLTGTDLIHFVPNTNFTGRATLSLRAWDGTTGTAGGTTNTAINGGATAFSTSKLIASVLVNRAPTIANATPNFGSVNEDTRFVAISINNVLAAAGVADLDVAALKGIAVTGASGPGSWKYYNGVNWQSLDSTSGTSARLLASTGTVYFFPSANQSGQATLRFRAWDQTTGANQGLVSTAINGDAFAFSSTEAAGTLSVVPVNDAPVFNTIGDLQLVPVIPNQPNPGTTISSIRPARHDS